MLRALARLNQTNGLRLKLLAEPALRLAYEMLILSSEDSSVLRGKSKLATQYSRDSIASLLRDAGWLVNPKRVERIWGQEGLKVPVKQLKKSRSG